MSWYHGISIPRAVKAVLSGQVVSLLVTGTGVCSQLLAQKYGVNAPATQSFLNYVLLAIVYGIFLFAIKRRENSVIHTFKTKSHIYLPLAIIDVEANYLVVKAYQYTSITSVMLLDCFTIPVALVLTYLFLKTKYNWRHLVGVVLCLVGLGILVYDDAVKNGSNETGSNPLLGDALCLGAAVLYAISNVGQEATVKKFTREEFLAMVGIFGSVVGGVQLAIFERDELRTMAWSGPVVGLLLGFAGFLFLMYSVVPYVLILSGSTLFNLSLLTSDAYAVIFGIFLFGKQLSVLYFIALVIIVGGLLLYNIRNEPTSVDPADGDDLPGGSGAKTAPTERDPLSGGSPSVQQRDEDIVKLTVDSDDPSS